MGEASCHHSVPSLSDLMKSSKCDAHDNVEPIKVELSLSGSSSDRPTSSKNRTLRELMREPHSKPQSSPLTNLLSKDIISTKSSNLSDLLEESQYEGSTKRSATMDLKGTDYRIIHPVHTESAAAVSGHDCQVSLSELMKKSKLHSANVPVQESVAERPLSLRDMMKVSRSDNPTTSVLPQRTDVNLSNVPEVKYEQKNESKSIEALKLKVKESSNVIRTESKSPSLSELMRMSQSHQKPSRSLQALKREQSPSATASKLSLSDLIRQSQAATTSDTADSQHESSSRSSQSTSISLSDLIRESKINERTKFQGLGKPESHKHKHRLVEDESVVGCLSHVSVPERSLSEIANYHLKERRHGGSSQLSAMLPSLDQFDTLGSVESHEKKEIVLVQQGNDLSLFGRCLKTTVETSSWLGKIHNKVQLKLTKQYEAEFLQTFNFSSPSPDDVVQEKQGHVFK